MTFRKRAAEIERDIKALKVEYDRYFNGALPLPPEPMRLEVERRLRQLKRSGLRTHAERFQCAGLEARLATLTQILNRKLREIELTGSVLRPAGGERRLDPYEGVVLADGRNRRAVEVLYHELYGSGGRGGKTDFASFQRYLDRQVEKLKKKSGCAEVRFRISNDAGKLKLRAKPVKT